MTTVPSFLTSIIGWLRAGYPDGVPAADYIPLVALLSRRLSSDEVRHVARQLCVTGEQPIDNVDIGTVITKVTNEMPREEDVARVRSRLALAGWPLAGPNTPA
jgi:hypothetical protein